MRRREFFPSFTAGIFAARAIAQAARKGLFRQSAMAVNFPSGTPMEEMCRQAARLGCKGFDLAEPSDWPTLKKFGLTPTLYHDAGNTFEDGIIHPEIHSAQETILHDDIDRAAAYGCPNVIVVGGQRRGMSTDAASDHAVTFLNRMKSHAEDKAVNIVLEPVSPADRPDQLLNRLGLAADICKRVNSARVKILFDIYHAQRIDGEVSDNIRKYFPWIAHFHTAGVPGRHEIDETQELNFHFIAQTIADLGYAGYIAHEYRPTLGRDPLQSLEQAIRIMTV